MIGTDAAHDVASDTTAHDRAELGALLELCALPQAGPARLRALLGGRSAHEAVAAVRTGPTDAVATELASRGVSAALFEKWRLRLEAADARAVAHGYVLGEQLLAAHDAASVWIAAPSQGAFGNWWDSDPEPPAVLFGQGAPPDLSRPRVGIVGTRRCTAYGRNVAKLLAEGLASNGVTVVSGLAAGIDGSAQRAALDTGGAVIGVVGSGLDCVYPASNRQLWFDVGRHGTLLSEYGLGTRALRWHFPARNRIVAALSDVLIVVESAHTGGSFHTVDAAIERNRPVMAVPGPITSPVSRGTNGLIAQGCAPVCDVADVLTALGWSGDHGNDARSLEAPEPPEGELERRLLDELTGQARTIDELVLRSNAVLGSVAAALGRLELSGWVAESAGWWEKAR